MYIYLHFTFYAAFERSLRVVYEINEGMVIVTATINMKVIVKHLEGFCRFFTVTFEDEMHRENVKLYLLKTIN